MDLNKGPAPIVNIVVEGIADGQKTLKHERRAERARVKTAARERSLRTSEISQQIREDNLVLKR